MSPGSCPGAASCCVGAGMSALSLCACAVSDEARRESGAEGVEGEEGWVGGVGVGERASPGRGVAAGASCAARFHSSHSCHRFRREKSRMAAQARRKMSVMPSGERARIRSAAPAPPRGRVWRFCFWRGGRRWRRRRPWGGVRGGVSGESARGGCGGRGCGRRRGGCVFSPR